MYKILLSDKYIKKEKSFIKKHLDLKERYGKTLLTLKANPYHPSLRLHKLQGTLKEGLVLMIS
jgi:mRNA-degrading endonuclease YafQ of YafQ-DinJ toxin-antitoxin module